MAAKTESNRSTVISSSAYQLRALVEEVRAENPSEILWDCSPTSAITAEKGHFVSWRNCTEGSWPSTQPPKISTIKVVICKAISISVATIMSKS